MNRRSEWKPNSWGMFLVVRCQHASGACQSHFCPLLSLCEVSQNYAELSHSTPPFLALCFHEKDLLPTPRLLWVRPILPPLGHILSIREGFKIISINCIAKSAKENQEGEANDHCQEGMVERRPGHDGGKLLHLIRVKGMEFSWARK